MGKFKFGARNEIGWATAKDKPIISLVSPPPHCFVQYIMNAIGIKIKEEIAAVMK